MIKPNSIIKGPIFPEPIQVITTIPIGDSSIKLIGKGLKSNKVYEPILDSDQISRLIISPEKEPFDGNSVKFRLGIEALRLGLAYEKEYTVHRKYYCLKREKSILKNLYAYFGESCTWERLNMKLEAMNSLEKAMGHHQQQ
jgi:hypothetical protein